MAKSPFYSITVTSTKRVITELVTDFRYEDCIDEDDIIVITMEGVTKSIVDSPDLRRGDTFDYRFGFLNGQVSPTRYAKIREVETSYTNKITHTLTAVDQGYVMKRERSKKTFLHMTTSQIAAEIADRFGMSKVIEKTDHEYHCIAMANRSYYKFMKYITTMEASKGPSYMTGPQTLEQQIVESQKALFNIGNPNFGKGPIRFFVSGNTLYYTRRDLSQSSRKKYIWNYGDGPVKGFRPKYSQDEDGASTEVQTQDMNPDTLEDYAALAGDSFSDSSEDELGTEKVNYDVNGKELGRSSGTNTYHPTMGGGNDEVEIQGKLNKENQEAALGELTGTLDLELDPNARADTVISLSGVARIHQGNWYVEKCVHRISGGGGSTELEMKKNGSSESAGAGSAASPNTSIGDVDASNKHDVKQYNYDVDGNLQTNDTTHE